MLKVQTSKTRWKQWNETQEKQQEEQTLKYIKLMLQTQGIQFILTNKNDSTVHKNDSTVFVEREMEEMEKMEETKKQKNEKEKVKVREQDCKTLTNFLVYLESTYDPSSKKRMEQFLLKEYNPNQRKSFATLVYFGNRNCRYCKQFEPIFLKLAFYFEYDLLQVKRCEVVRELRVEKEEKEQSKILGESSQFYNIPHFPYLVLFINGNVKDAVENGKLYKEVVYDDERSFASILKWIYTQVFL